MLACWLVGGKPVDDRKVFTCNRKVTEALQQIGTGSEQITCTISHRKGHVPTHLTNPKGGTFWLELSMEPSEKPVGHGRENPGSHLRLLIYEVCGGDQEFDF